MGRESKTTKFSLEKFEVAKLKNLVSIKGGDGDDDTGGTNDTLSGSSRQCAASRNSNPPCDKDIKDLNDGINLKL